MRQLAGKKLLLSLCCCDCVLVRALHCLEETAESSSDSEGEAPEPEKARQLFVKVHELAVAHGWTSRFAEALKQSIETIEFT